MSKTTVNRLRIVTINPTPIPEANRVNVISVSLARHGHEAGTLKATARDFIIPLCSGRMPLGGGETMTCDICGGEICPGDEYYEMPDGLTVCTEDSDCLSSWAEDYKRTYQGNAIEGLVIRI